MQQQPFSPREISRNSLSVPETNDSHPENPLRVPCLRQWASKVGFNGWRVEGSFTRKCAVGKGADVEVFRVTHADPKTKSNAVVGILVLGWL